MKRSIETQNLIIDSANELFYRQGYHHTGFGDIERVTGLSRGNITYHFKTKKNILQEIVSRRLQRITKNLKGYDNEAGGTKEAIIKLCEGILSNSKEIKEYGCPMGTLISEMAKNDEEIHKFTVVMFQTYLDWLETKFIALDCDEKTSKQRAKSLLARLQGIALMAHALGDEGFLIDEINKIRNEFS